MFRHCFALVLLLLVAFAPLGCSDDSSPRTIVTLETINADQTLNSDVYNNGDDRIPNTEDDVIFEDQVSIQLRSRAHDPVLDLRSGGPFGGVTFYRYEVRFDGDETLATVYGAMHLRIPAGGTAAGEVTIVPADFKDAAPLSSLRTGGELRFTAAVTLIGEEDDSQDEVRVTALLPVHCANWSDPE